MPATVPSPTTSVAIAPPLRGRAAKKWSVLELRLKVAELKAHLSTGMSEIQIAEEMGLDAPEYNELKREMYNADKLEMAGKNSEEVFIDYRLRQEGCIKDLETMVKEFTKSKQYNAMVGAIKAKSDIIDRIVARGQEFGVLEKVPEKKQIVAGVLVAGLSNEEIRARVAKQTVGMSEMLKKYGDGDILSLPDPVKTLPPSTSTVTVEPVKPAFNAGLKPKTTVGGAAKAIGGKAAVASKKILPPPFSLAD